MYRQQSTDYSRRQGLEDEEGKCELRGAKQQAHALIVAQIFEISSHTISLFSLSLQIDEVLDT